MHSTSLILFLMHQSRSETERSAKMEEMLNPLGRDTIMETR